MNRISPICFLGDSAGGSGWRLPVTQAEVNTRVLIGGQTWAFELTAAEWKELVALVGALRISIVLCQSN